MKEKYWNYIVLDCETGGTSADKSPITQVAVVVINGRTLEEMHRYCTFVQPYGMELGLTIQQQALDYTGITRAQIEKGIPIKQCVQELIEILSVARQHNTHVAYKPIVVGHNVQFDISFLTAAFDYCKQDWKKATSPDYWCTMRMSQARHSHQGPEFKYNLEACCEREGIELIDGHDALNDTIATKELFVSMIRNLRSQGNEDGDEGEGRVERRMVKFHI